MSIERERLSINNEADTDKSSDKQSAKPPKKRGGQHYISKSNKSASEGGSSATKGIFEWIQSVVNAIVIVVLLLTFVFRVICVDGKSMMNTLLDGDRVIVTNFNYIPQNGDIVVLSRGAKLEKTLIKRVIATEGQTVDIDFETGVVTVDNVIIDEPYIKSPTLVSYDMEFPLTVEKGTVFVMGDNRPVSNDSRSSEVGLVSTDNVIGKAQFVIYPLNRLEYLG